MKKKGKKGQKRAEKKADRKKTAEIVAKLDELAVRAAKENEEHISELFAPPPPREECPICMLPLPIDDGNVLYVSCCSALLCCGCYGANWRSIEKTNEKNAKRKVPLVKLLCPFCREPDLTTTDEHLTRLEKWVDRDNARAMYALAGRYVTGKKVPRDSRKALELYIRAAEFDSTSANAYYQIYVHYSDGIVVSKDVKKERIFMEIAARKGNPTARHDLAIDELGRGNLELAIKHMHIGAAAGWQGPLDTLKRECLNGNLSHEELMKAYRAFQAARDAEKSKERDRWAMCTRPKMAED